MPYRIITPSRFGSSCLSSKPLKDTTGKPMVWHVNQRTLETNIGARNIVVATDNKGVFDVCAGFDIQVLMTREDHESGIDRLAEVAGITGWKYDEMVVNLLCVERVLPAAYCTDSKINK